MWWLEGRLRCWTPSRRENFSTASPARRRMARQTPSALRDRALFGVMVLSFARVSAVVGMTVHDYHQGGEELLDPAAREGGAIAIPSARKA
jgi:hypothetical protein